MSNLRLEPEILLLLLQRVTCAACAALLLWLLCGCASTQERFGDHARYSPALRGYVLAAYEGSDDPEVGEAVLVLRDPLTGSKLRCRRQVVAWREVQEDLAADLVHDDNVALAVGTTTGVVFAPLLALQPLGGAVVVEAMMVAGALHDDLSADDAYELLGKAIVAFRRKRYDRAADYLELALAKDASVGVLDLAYFYLGLTYVHLGNDDRARLALSLFIDRAAVRNVQAYRRAETTLDELGVARDSCGSTEPVRVFW